MSLSQFTIVLSHRVLRALAPDFLSFTLDTSLVLGGQWWGEEKKMRRGVSVNRAQPLDFDQELLHFYASALAPAMLRIGGTEADRVRYQLGKKGSAETHDYVLKKKLWKKINTFSQRNGLTVLFTLSAGPDDRDETGAWIESNARALIAYTVRKKFPVTAWELGNEVNGFPFLHGLRARVTGKQYAADFQRLGRLLRELQPRAKALGPSSAVWPLIGEPNPMIPALCKSRASVYLDAVSWHYYPQQSSYGRVAVRRVGEKTLLNARNLNGILRWIRSIRRSLARVSRTPGSPATENWLTETANALYGGEPGISDTFISTLWWLDELGLLAREGVDKVFRQSLVGSRYGLLDEFSLDPRPDYYASFLWKKLMGELVFEAPTLKGPHKKLRVYQHGRAASPGTRTLLFINLSGRTSARLTLPAVPERIHRLEGWDGLRSQHLKVNGVFVEKDLVANWGKKKTALKYSSDSREAEITLPPLSCTFVELIV